MAIGFWRAWGLVVGMMIGSGIFTLPAVLAPFGSYSFVGWGFTLLGALSLVFCLSFLARRNPRAGGPSAYVYDAFGRWPAVLVAWCYWISLVVAVAAIALSFSGYLAVYVPAFTGSTFSTTLVALSVIWLFTAVSLRGTEQASVVQLITTVLKLVPLLLIGVLGLKFGNIEAVTASNPEGVSEVSLIAGIMLLIMWSYIGIEAATIPADETHNPSKTIPRALLAGTLTATAVYVIALAGVMALIPQAQLAQSEHPFADAAFGLMGAPGAMLIGFGALVSIGGALNACVFLSGGTPSAGVRDGLFPAWLGQKTGSGNSARAIILSSSIASLLVILNASKGLVGAYQAMIVLSTFSVVIVYCGSSLASLKQHLSTGDPVLLSHWLGVFVSIVALLFTLAALYGASTLY